MHRDSLSNDSGLIVFNQMCDDAEFALETAIFCLLTIPHTCTPLKPFSKIIFHKVRKVEGNYKDIHGLHCT